MPMYKKISLLSSKPKTSKITSLIIIFILVLLIISYKLKIYSVYKTLAVINCEDTCYIETSIPSTKSELIDKYILIEYDNHKYQVNKVYLEDIISENDQLYLKVKIDSNLTTEKNKIINIKILYDKQRIITKLKNIMKG